MTKWLKKLWFKLTYDEIAIKYRRPLGKSLFIFVLMSGICSAQTSILTYDVNGVTRLHARLNAPYVPSDPPPVYPPSPVYIGIPSPTFGIDETYRMYDISDSEDPNYCRNPDLTYNPSDSNGYYTHYVDPDDEFGVSTDTNNQYGTKEHPRTSLPAMPLPAGSILEIHSGTFTSGIGAVTIKSYATEDMPTFIRGSGTGTHRFAKKIRAEGTYMILEGIDAAAVNVMGEYATPNRQTSHVCVRNSEFYSTTQGAGGINVGEYETSSLTRADHVVIYNNISHHFGDINAPTDKDYGCAFVGSKCSYVWFLDNTFHTSSGSGLQILPSNSITGQTAEKIYVGGNIAYQNRQAGLAIKYGLDVIFSQNIAHDIINTSWSISKGFGFQYNPSRVWYLFNTSYNNYIGIRSGSGLGGRDDWPRDEFYFLGNLIYDCSVSGIQLNALEPPTPAKVIANTIYNCPISIENNYYSAKMDIYNNILAQYTNAVNTSGAPTTDDNSNMDYNLLDGSGNIVWGSTYNNIAALMAGTTQGDNCVEADPLFVDAENGDFDLNAISPFKSISDSPAVDTIVDRFYELYDIDISNEIRALRLTGVQKAP